MSIDRCISCVHADLYIYIYMCVCLFAYIYNHTHIYNIFIPFGSIISGGVVRGPRGPGLELCS